MTVGELNNWRAEMRIALNLEIVELNLLAGALHTYRETLKLVGKGEQAAECDALLVKVDEKTDSLKGFGSGKPPSENR